MEFHQAFNITRGLEHGWAAFKRAPLPLFLGGLFMQCTEGGSGGSNSSSTGSSWDDGGSSSGMDLDYRLDLSDFLQADVAPFPPEILDLGLLAGLSGMVLFGVVLAGMICGGLMWALRSWVHTGYIRLHVRALISGEGGFEDLLSGSDRLFPMMLWKLLKVLITTGAVLVSGLPGAGLLGFGYFNQSTPAIAGGVLLLLLICVPALLYISLGLAFGDHAVALDELGPTAALEKSWEIADGNRLHLFLFLLVYGIAKLVALLLGVLMLCVGMLVTLPIARAVTDVGFTEGYLLMTGRAGMDDLTAVFD